jgi:hypothetical protein
VVSEVLDRWEQRRIEQLDETEDLTDIELHRGGREEEHRPLRELVW